MEKIMTETLYYILSTYVGACLFKQQKCNWYRFAMVQAISTILIVLSRYYIKF